MDTDIGCCIGKASGTFAKLSARVWDYPTLTTRTKLVVLYSELVAGKRYVGQLRLQYKDYKAQLEELKCGHWWVGKAHWQPQQMALSYQQQTMWKVKDGFKRPNKKKKESVSQWFIFIFFCL